MQPVEQANQVVEILNDVGVVSKLLQFTNGGAAVKFMVSQNGKPREAEFQFFAGKSPKGSKYVYLLPDDLFMQIEKMPPSE